MPWFRFFALAACAASLATCMASAAQPGELRDIAPPVAIPEDAVWPIYAAIFGVLAVALAAAMRIVRRRRAAALASQSEAMAPPLSPREAALAALSELEHIGGNPKPYYTRLVEIVRRYIAGRFELNEPDSTASELLAQFFRLKRIAPELRRTLESLFAEAELVKFAAFIPQADAPRRAIESARAFIEETSDVV